jgi:2-hydroxychromene-2-carboxylate isomerase
MKGGWGKEFVCVAYRRWLRLGQDSGSEPNVLESLREVGQEPERVDRSCEQRWVQQMPEDETAGARDLGIFGSPTFVVGKELFWGDDRFELAQAWSTATADS